MHSQDELTRDVIVDGIVRPAYPVGDIEELEYSTQGSELEHARD